MAVVKNRDSATEYALVFTSPLGPLGVRIERGAVTGIDYLPASRKPANDGSPAAHRVARALMRYFENGARPFGLDLALAGTDFQQRVWRALQAIPPGETRTYGELARELGSGARAVGNACRHNPVPVMVPCHRVVRAAGLGGYAGRMSGAPLSRKRWLLTHEGAAMVADLKRC